MKPNDARILAVNVGLDLLCVHQPEPAVVRGGVLRFYWWASQRRRDREIRGALRAAGLDAEPPSR